MKLTIRMTALVVTLSLMACGKGFQNTIDTANKAASDALGQGSPAIDPLASVEYKGVQANGDTPGRLMFEIDKPNQALIMILPIPAELLVLLGKIQVTEIPDLPGATVMPYKGSDGSSNLAVSIPIKYIIRGGSFMDPAFDNRLPSGDKIPAFPDGEGASFALTINRGSVVHVYVGVSAAAVFIETPDWDTFLNCNEPLICLGLSFGPWEVKNSAKTEILGYVAVVPAKSTFHSGAFVTAQFPAALSRFLDDHLKN